MPYQSIADGLHEQAALSRAVAGRRAHQHCSHQHQTGEHAQRMEDQQLIALAQ
ncbi:MAG: hypothetical protein ACK4WM_06195 [Thermoflexales bacterium]